MDLHQFPTFPSESERVMATTPTTAAASDAEPPLTSLYKELQRETQRILCDCIIESSIELLIHCDHEIWRKGVPLHRARPQVTLTFECEDEEGSGVVDRKLPAALAGIAVILNHSFRLNKFPELKANFWRELLMTNMLIREDPYEEPYVDDWLWMVQDESFPVFRIDMNRRGIFTAKHMAVFYKFLTTKPSHGVSSEYAEQYEALLENQFVPITLMLGLSKTTAKCLQRMYTLLDEVYTAPTRHYAISHLDLNYHVTKAPELQCVETILSKNNYVYKISSVRLINIARAFVSCEKEDVEALQQVIVAALDTSASPASTSLSEQPSAPQALGVLCTSLGLKHVMALCSALRYGCKLDTLELQDIFHKVDKLEREQSWRWLAFGLFYPRSSKLAAANKLRHLDLSRNLIEPEDAEAFIKTLEDPARELVYGGGMSQLQTSQAVGKIFTCLVKQDAKFYETAKTGTKPISTLDRERHLEVLCQEEDWTCVVLPGLGFGWVANDQIVKIEEEAIDEDSLRFELKFAYLPPTNPAHVGFFSFITRVGRHLSFLDMSASLVDTDSQTLADILKECVHVKHLVLRSMMLDESHVDELLKALRGDLGQRLISLDMSGNLFRDSVFDKLAELMESSLPCVPMLQELRITDRRGTSGVLTAVERMLQVNKTMRLLHFGGPLRREWHEEGDRAAEEVYDRIQEAHQCELLVSPLPLERKLAFLSVMGPQIECKDSARSALDSFMVSAIFKFAASEAPRRIFWY